MQEDQNAGTAFLGSGSGPKIIFLGPKPPPASDLEKLAALQIPYICFNSITSVMSAINIFKNKRKFVITEINDHEEFEQFVEGIKSAGFLIYVVLSVGVAEQGTKLADLLARDKNTN